MRIFDDTINFNKPIICGENTTSKIKVTNFKGKTILEENIRYKVGDSKYPAIFSYALFNKSPGGIRSVIAKAKYLKNNDTQSIKGIESDNELVLIEFNN